MIEDELAHHRINSIVLDEYDGSGYGSAMNWVAAKLKELGVTVAIELHFNSAGVSANGHEFLYWHSSKKGKRLAVEITNDMCLGVPEIKCRGAKPRTHLNRGSTFLRKTHCPALVAEPFFGSSPWDWGVALTKKRNIARAIAQGILSYLEDE